MTSYHALKHLSSSCWTLQMIYQEVDVSLAPFEDFALDLTCQAKHTTLKKTAELD